MFETIEGGFLDIDVKIVGPDGKVIYQVIINEFAQRSSILNILLSGRPGNERKIYVCCL